jgi:hypothetical protein
MRIYVESVLPCKASAAWEEVQKSALLREVAQPMVRLLDVPGEAMPQRWTAKTTVRCRPLLFGLIPMGTRQLYFQEVDHSAREIQTRERDPLVKRWDHRIRVEPAGRGKCRYSDEIKIDAGWLTPIVGLFAHWFYRHRQRRWQFVAQRLSEREQELEEVPGSAALCRRAV